MGPKKKGDGRTKTKVGNAPHDGSSSRPTVQKGVAQLQISAENQQRLRRLLQNSSQVSSRSSSSPQGITSSREPLSQLEKQQATRRLRVIYDKLVSEGFSAGQIELGLSSFAAGEATLENVLDWLCLNIPGDELPKKFSSGVVDVDMEGSTVQLLAAAKKDWVPSMARSEIHEESHGLQLLVKNGNVKDDVVETSMKAHTAEWVKQYMYQLEEDSEDGGSLSSNDVNSDWEALAESQDRRHGGFEKIIQNHKTRTISEIISEFRYAKVAAADAKLKGDKQRQAISGQVIRRLKQELAAMGLSEDILCMNQTTADKRTDAEEVSEQCRDAELHLNMPVELPGDISVDKITEDSKVEEQIESEDSLSGMFNEDSTTQNVLPSSVVQMQNKEKVMSWGLQTSDKKQKQQKDKKSSNQENLQRQPKAILQQQCQKRGWGLPKYVKESEAMNLYTYTVTIMRPDSGRGKNRTLGGKNTYKVPGESAGSKSIEEAQNIVATWTLFSLFPELPLYHIIPEPYRTMMLQWHAEGSETMKTDELQRERNRRANFIESLVTFKEQPEDGEVAWSSEGTNNSFARHHKEEIRSDSTRSSAKADPEKAKREAHLQNAESRNLLLEYQVKQKEKAYKKMLESRMNLPIFSAKEEIIHQICNNPVVVICGETGSGKTTQVPQFIFEELVSTNQGALCNIVCTQPRRLAAISIAERVSVEQNEGPPGSSKSFVGYQVRLDSAWHQRTKILFCTTGILLRRLAGDRELTGVSHVIVDEVHERSILGDFLLIILKDLLQRRQIREEHPLKIILMSATVDATIFSSYFGNCPVVKVEGRTFPVKTFYLEDIYEMLDYHLASDSSAVIKNTSTKMSKNARLRNIVKSSRGRQNLVQYGWDDDEVVDEEAINPHFDELLYQSYSVTTKNSLRKLNEDVIDFDVLEELIIYIDKTGEKGAILVFLPGMGDILSLINRLVSLEHFRGALSDWILPLHSSVSTSEQHKVFQVPPSGVRKIVVATNIAETSITIEDIVHVIDSGKHKEMQHDPHKGMSRMEETWVSQANVKQRRGRAGRVQAGYCFSLYTKHRFEKLLRPFQLPEIRRVPLVELCLQIKNLSLGNISNFLEKALEKPKAEAVASAVTTLQEVGALDSNEELTALGFHLAKLPVDVHIGKMILYGVILGCLNPILTIAACLSYKSPFSTSREQLSGAENAKRAFVEATKSSDMSSSICRGQQSDQLVMAAAYKGWSTVIKRHGERAGYAYCKSNFLNIPTLIMLRDMRQQFAVLLADIGFISTQEVNVIKASVLDHWVDDEQRPFNRNSHLSSIIKATMCAGFYPNIAKMDDESIRSGHANALTSRAGLASSEKVIWTDGHQQVFIHPSSVNYNVSEFQHPFLLYNEKVKTNKVYIRDTTVVSPYTLLLFGGTISVQHQTGQVSVDGWLKMNAPAQTAVLFKEIRSALDLVLQELIKNPKISAGVSCNDVVSIILKLLVEEGVQ